MNTVSMDAKTGLVTVYGDASEPTAEQHDASQRLHRQAAFQREADPLFFKWQAGEGAEADWLAKRAEIRAQYPYHDEE